MRAVQSGERKHVDSEQGREGRLDERTGGEESRERKREQRARGDSVRRRLNHVAGLDRGTQGRGPVASPYPAAFCTSSRSPPSPPSAAAAPPAPVAVPPSPCPGGSCQQERHRRSSNNHPEVRVSLFQSLACEDLPRVVMPSSSSLLSHVFDLESSLRFCRPEQFEPLVL
eukprot:749450-Hanusia_phi.AAC.6